MIFSQDSLGRSMMVGYYCGFLVYAELCRRYDTPFKYVERFMKATTVTFQEEVNNIYKKVLNKNNDA